MGTSEGSSATQRSPQNRPRWLAPASRPITSLSNALAALMGQLPRRCAEVIDLCSF